MQWRRSLALIAAVACFAGSTSRAAEIEGVVFRDRFAVGSSELQLHGVGLLRYRLLFKGYVAALYLAGSSSKAVTPSSVLADAPRRLEIEYFWKIPADAFAKITVEWVERNTDPAGLQRLRQRIARFNTLYQDVEPGDRYALTYVPGVGTELALNGRRLGLVEGADFSAAIFSIWFGENPVDESLREQLLAAI
jgi:hypothetical protein